MCADASGGGIRAVRVTNKLPVGRGEGSTGEVERLLVLVREAPSVAVPKGLSMGIRGGREGLSSMWQECVGVAGGLPLILAGPPLGLKHSKNSTSSGTLF